MAAPMFAVTEFNGYAVEFSPFEEGRLAVATAQHFGIVGQGRQYVYQVHPDGLEPIFMFDTRDGIYDCAWSEANENHLISACADGSLKLWDLGSALNPLASFEEHVHEVNSVDWSGTAKNVFVSGSWDYTIKVWSPDRPTALQTYNEHVYCVYATVWSPRIEGVFASVAGDFTMKIWDVREPDSTLSIKAHDYEILAVDWNKYNDNVLATGAVDKLIRLWDLRKPDAPFSELHGHQYAVRRLKFSPHSEAVLASVSYDMSTMLWDTAAPEDSLLQVIEQHTEFAVGLDFNLFVEGQMATCGWDETVHVFQQGEEVQPVYPPPPPPAAAGPSLPVVAPPVAAVPGDGGLPGMGP